MPNLPTHVVIAAELAETLDEPMLKKHMGALLLGSTTPDIRIITRAPRELTHFSTLESEGITTGIETLLKEHPELVDSSKVSEETRAFLLGYFTHLIADQSWIANVYRPYFGNAKVFPDHVEANVLDRALQLSMDYQQWDVMRKNLPLFDRAEQGVDIGFITQETLESWREWTQEYLARDFSWERLRYLAGRRQEESSMDAAHEVAEKFLSSVDKGLEHIAERVSATSVRHYRRQTMQYCLKMSQEYLQQCG